MNAPDANPQDRSIQQDFERFVPGVFSECSADAAGLAWRNDSLVLVVKARDEHHRSQLRAQLNRNVGMPVHIELGGEAVGVSGADGVTAASLPWWRRTFERLGLLRIKPSGLDWMPAYRSTAANG
jgi:hypothetical protein